MHVIFLWMLFLRAAVLLGFVAIANMAAAADRTFMLLEDGQHLSPADAAALQAKVARKSNDLDDRIRLLSFYAYQPPAGNEESSIRASRLQLISWIVERQPRAMLFNLATRVYAVQTTGGPLADPAGFQSVEKLWQSQIASHPDDLQIKRNAATFTELQDPEFAEKLVLQTGDRRWLGQVYAKAVLGIVASDYTSSDPALADEGRRNSPFAQQALKRLEASNDPLLLGGAAFTLCRDGGILYSEDKLNFDYTPLAKRLLAKAASLDPVNNDVFSVVPELPLKGQRPPVTVRLGGQAAGRNLLSHVQPDYPAQAKLNGVQGTVTLLILIGLDGHVLKVAAKDGPDPLRSAAIDAVKQWTYSPTRLNGKPVYVLTTAAVNFSEPRI